MRPTLLTSAAFLCLFATAPLANAQSAQGGSQSESDEQQAPGEPPFEAEPVADLLEPWAMTFLPDGRLLVTEKKGTLHIVTQDGEVSDPIPGTPEVDYGGQGGLGDVVLAPDFDESGTVYLTFAEAGDGDVRGAAMGRGTLNLEEMTLDGFETIWRQEPKVPGRGHYGHRIAFSPDGQYLFLTSGERQKFDPAQNLDSNLGAVLRLNPDGTAAEGNPFADRGSPGDQIWSYGHRNPLGIAFAPDGTLWQHEMGPKGGDEFQEIEESKNYGYPIVSNGDHYDGRDIPDHDTRPEFRAPEEFWNPVISPAGMIFYTGDAFPDWQDDALIGGLSSEAIIVATRECPDNGRDVCEETRYDMGERIREIELGPDGTVWVLEDGMTDEAGRLLHLVPRD